MTAMTTTTTQDTAPARSPWAIVMRREILVRLTDKGFIAGTLLTLAILGGWLGFSAYQEQRTSTYAVVTTTDAARMGAALAAQAADIDDRIELSTRVVADADAATAAVRDGDAQGWLHQGESGWVLTTQSEEGQLLSVTAAVVRATVLDDQARELGTTAAELEAGSMVSAEFLVGDAERAGLASGVGFAMAFLFYIATLVFGMQIAYSVVEEKQSRIVEIIAASIPVRQLLAGKVLGNTVLAVLQTMLYAGVGLIGMSFTPYRSFVGAIGGPVAWFVLFFAAGFLALACLWAVAGALASRTEDLQSTSTPLTLLVVAVFLSGLLLDGSAKVVASFVPPLSGVLMPIRILEGDVPLWQPILALVLMMLFALGTIVLGERLYRRSLLQNQGRVSLRQAWSAAE